MSSDQTEERINNVMAGKGERFVKSSSTYSVDNESGFEDTLSDANDTLNDSIEQESEDTGCVDTSTSTTSCVNIISAAENESLDKSNDDAGEDDENADTLADDISLLSLDHLELNTRPSSSSSSFSSSYFSTGSGRRSSRIPVRTSRPVPVKKEPSVSDTDRNKQ